MSWGRGKVVPGMVFEESQNLAKSEFSPETMQRVLKKRSDIYWEPFSSGPVGAASALALYAVGLPGIPELGEIRVITGLSTNGLAKTYGQGCGGVPEWPGRRGAGPKQRFNDFIDSARQERFVKHIGSILGA